MGSLLTIPHLMVGFSDIVADVEVGSEDSDQSRSRSGSQQRRGLVERIDCVFECGIALRMLTECNKAFCHPPPESTMMRLVIIPVDSLW